MKNDATIDTSDAKHLVDPPIIDFLAFDSDLRAYVAEFIPERSVSAERKESVYLNEGTPTARRVGELLAVISGLLGTDSPVVRIAHAGGGDFDFYTQANAQIALHQSSAMETCLDIYRVLQVLSVEIQLEFLSQRRALRRAV